MEQVIVRHVVPFVQDELVGIYDTPFANHENVHACNRFFPVKTDDVCVQVTRRNGMLLVRKRIHSVVTLASPMNGTTAYDMMEDPRFDPGSVKTPWWSGILAKLMARGTRARPSASWQPGF